MAIDPHEIILTTEQQQQLADLADRTGRPWPELLAEVIKSYHPESRPTAQRGRGTFYDTMKDVIGLVQGAPSDLSSNPKHMEGFGSACDASVD